MVGINDLLRRSTIDLNESILILSKLLNVDKSYIFTYGDREVADSLGKDFLRLVEKRKSGYPLQYILGTREFMALDFLVEDGVLIPRIDTETLVEYIIEYIKDKYDKREVRVLDLGYGSGAIALSIGYYCENSQVYGVDISDHAYRLANKNKDRLGLGNVVFLKGDLFSPLVVEGLDKKFDIIVSNPPYIESDVLDTLDVEVREHEPRLALDGGQDGLGFYREITSKALEHLNPGGLLIYEIGYKQARDVKKILINNGFRDINVIEDLSGNDRVVLGFK